MTLISRITKIEELHNQIEDKDALCMLLAEKYNKKPLSIKRNWFLKSTFYNVPEKYFEEVVNVMKEIINKQDVMS